MDNIEYQSPPPSAAAPSALLWTIAGFVVLAAVAVITWATMTMLGATGQDWMSYVYQSLIILGTIGIVVLEVYSLLLKSQRASEALGAIFCLPALAVVPPLIEALLGIVHVPGIHQSVPDWKTAGILLVIGVLGGLVGFVHFQWYGRLRQAPMRVESIEQPEQQSAPTQPEPAP